MDLIYTDADRNDVGVMRDYTFDLAFGSDENDFELTLDVNHHCCKADCLVYIEGTEYGGIIDKIGVVTKDAALSYRGRTWHGILAGKVIEAGTVVSGEANVVLAGIVEKLGLSDLFTTLAEDSKLEIDNYTFKNFVDGYSGIITMLESISAKVRFKFVNGKVLLSALPIVDYSKDEQFDSDSVEMEIEQIHNPVNHLICVPEVDEQTGERDEVIHLYLNPDGNVSTHQSAFGVKEVTEIYEASGDTETYHY